MNGPEDYASVRITGNCSLVNIFSVYLPVRNCAINSMAFIKSYSLYQLCRTRLYTHAASHIQLEVD